jgi:hypothetical protein
VGAGTAGEQLWHQTVPSLLPRPIPGLTAAVSCYGGLECLSYARKDTLNPHGGIPFAVVPRGRCDFLGGCVVGQTPKGRGSGWGAVETLEGRARKLASRVRCTEGRGGRRVLGSIPSIRLPSATREPNAAYTHPPAATVAQRPPKWASPLRHGRVPLPRSIP